jgi:H+-transporting ATPase
MAEEYDYSQHFVDAKTRLGLTDDEAEDLRTKWGWNALEEVKVSKLWLFFVQFTGTMPYMLWVAALISAATEDWADMAILLTMLICNGVLGFREEVSFSSSSMLAVHCYTSPLT